MDTENGITNTTENLKELTAKKEQELKHLQELHSTTLESNLKKKEEELRLVAGRLNKLKDDFKYNLTLLYERDAELRKYEQILAELRRACGIKDEEVKIIKAELEDCKAELSHEGGLKEEQRRHYEHRLQRAQQELEQIRRVKEGELDDERRSLESVKQQFELRVSELEAELDAQRRSQEAEFSDVTRRRDHDHRVQVDELRAALLSVEIKVRLAEEELERMKNCTEKSRGEAEQLETIREDLKQELLRKDQELGALTTRLAALGLTLDEKEVVAAQAQAFARDKQSQLETELQSANDRVRKLEQELMKQESREKDMQQNWQADKQRLGADIETLSKQCESFREWAGTLEEDEAARRRDLEQMSADIDRYKMELSEGLRREESVQRGVAQLEIDWQRKNELNRREEFRKSEQLIGQLSSARDNALADLAVTREELKLAREAIQNLREERGGAIKLSSESIDSDRQSKALAATPTSEDIATVKSPLGVKPGLVSASPDVWDANHSYISAPDTVGVNSSQRIAPAGVNVNPTHSGGRVKQLEQQNEDLRIVIRQMRMELENLAAAAAASQQQREQQQKEQLLANTTETITNETDHLIGSDRQPMTISDTSEVLSQAVKGNALIDAHVSELNDLIGSLRTDKAELIIQVRKHQLKIVNLQTEVERLTKQPREKQVELDQLRYELGVVQRRSGTELLQLRQRVHDLELELVETRKEVDEYSKVSIERNNEVTALQNQVSHLKLQAARASPTINLGAQELLIQQLQDEVSHLRNLLSGKLNNSENLSDDLIGAECKTKITKMKEQLRLAARYISRLAGEKQLLIDMGNRLRAELTRNGLKVPHQTSGAVIPQHSQSNKAPSHAAVRGSDSDRKKQEGAGSRLEDTERLHYELMKRELMAQKLNSAQAELTNHQSSLTSVAASKPMKFNVTSNGPSSCKNQMFNQPTPLINVTNQKPAVITAMTNRTSNQNISTNQTLQSHKFTNHDALRPEGQQKSHTHPVYTGFNVNGNLHDPPERLVDQSEAALRWSSSSLGGGGESMDELWRMVEAGGGGVSDAGGGTSDRVGGATSKVGGVVQVNTRRADLEAGSGLLVQGSTLSWASRSTTRKNLSARATGRVSTVKNRNKKQQTIRNYNLRDSEEGASTTNNQY